MQIFWVFGAPAAGTALEDVAVMQQSVEHGRDSRSIAEKLAPILDGPVRGEKRADPFVPAHDQLKQVFAGRGRQLAHPQVVDDQQRRRGKRQHSFLPVAGDGGIGKLFEQDVSFAIKDLVALLDGRVSDGLGEVALSGACLLYTSPSPRD